jgi:hypothetical protein
MSIPTISRLVQGRNLRAVTAQLILLTALGLGMANYYREIYSRIMGPFVVTATELAQIANPDRELRRVFTLAEGKATRLNVRGVTKHSGRRGRGSYETFTYYFAISGPKTLLIKSSSDTVEFPLTVTLEAGDAGINSSVLRAHPELARGGGLAPILLETEDPSFSFGSIATGAALIGSLVLLGLLFLSLRRLLDFRRSPSVAALSRFNAPIDQTVAHIDGELAAADPSTAMKRVLMTPTWLINKQSSGLDIVNLNDVVWVYSSVLTRKIYGLIPYWWSYFVHIGDRNGTMTKLKGSKKQVPVIMEAVVGRVPWVLAGYSDELEKAYKRERAEVTAAVDQRRDQAEAGATPAPSRV